MNLHTGDDKPVDWLGTQKSWPKWNQCRLQYCSTFLLAENCKKRRPNSPFSMQIGRASFAP